MNLRQKSDTKLERPVIIPGQFKFKPKNYDHLIGMKGFSDKLLSTHFKLYQGYVSNTNTLLEELDSLVDHGKNYSPSFAELKRRLGWEFNGMLLHEHYFDNLLGSESNSEMGPLAALIKNSFGTIERWKKEFLATGATRGIGWVILYYDPPSQRLFNMWIEEHHMNHIAGGVPLLVMDVFEHAYMTDYGTDKSKYFDAFLTNINWKIVENRYEGFFAINQK